MFDSKFYYLDDEDKVQETSDVTLWAETNGDSKKRTVGLKQLNGLRVSTVFLGLDHNFAKQGEPVLWESMVFPDDSFLDLDCARCSGTRADAEKMHEEMVSKWEHRTVDDVD